MGEKVTNLDAAKALQMIGRTERRKAEGKPPPIAVCPFDRDEPLVMTLDRPGYEFTCLRCGRWFGFLDPVPAEPTPELDALVEQRAREYKAARDA